MPRRRKFLQSTTDSAAVVKQRALNDTRAELVLDAVIFDMDGVVTQTARLHAASWKELFDEFLQARVDAGHGGFAPFDPQADYLAYVDGKPRHEGVRSFLAARGVQVPEGDATDGPDAMSVAGLGARKDALFVARMRRDGVEVFASTLAFVHRLRARGVKTAVVTSSRNGREVLRLAGVEELFDVRVDGIDAATLGLRGKPDPDPFLRAAALLGVSPMRAAIIEDASVGVEAGRRGGFDLVVGVDRGGNRERLLECGADFVVADLGELDISALDRWARRAREDRFAWTVEQDGFDPAREHGIESIFTVGNGYVGVRGALDAPLPGSHADLFVAGVYDRKSADRPYSEVEFIGDARGDNAHAEIVTLPFPFRARIAVDGVVLDPTGRHCRAHRRTLDLRRGILHGYAEYDTDVDRRVVVRARRCASRSDLHLLLQEVTVTLVNHSGVVELDAGISDPDLASNHPHLTALPGPLDDTLDIQRFTTQASNVEVCVVARTMLDGRDQKPDRRRIAGSIGRTITIRRLVAIYTSLDVSDPLAVAMRCAQDVSWADFDQELAAHIAKWKDVWDRADVSIAGHPAVEQALRFNAYHLISAADLDPRVSVGARALTGRAYEGHVFWDVEMFKLPFYLHTFPELAATLLRYRHTTLDGARRKAQELGYRGACYAWESTVTGDDVTPRSIRLKSSGKEIPIFTGTQQVHVTAGVAHGIWRYWEATRDASFMIEAGVEILVETARFWTSRCTPGPRHFHIREVVGPDEYHHSVNDNAYTNWLARFNLERALDGIDWLQRYEPRGWGAFAERMALEAEELETWRNVACDLFCPAPNARGVIEQFEGFFDLEDYPLAHAERFKAPIDRLFQWDRINRMKLIKQPDVLMLAHVLPDAFAPEVVAANYRYYEPITDHASSLSPGIHAAVAARIGLREDAERYWRESLWLDLSDRMSNSALGLHLGCMGATWQALVFGFLGVHFGDAEPTCESSARLPAKWRRVALTLAWRNRLHGVQCPQEVRS
jgi:beta-phosphoglucomutase family hydrolase